jgi:hypothetical protein
MTTRARWHSGQLLRRRNAIIIADNVRRRKPLNAAWTLVEISTNSSWIHSQGATYPTSPTEATRFFQLRCTQP